MSTNGSFSGIRSNRSGTAMDDIFEEMRDYNAHHERNGLQSNQQQFMSGLYRDSRLRSVPVEEIHEINSRLNNSEIDENLGNNFCKEDFCWVWDDETKSADVLVQNHGREAYFHPDYSCGTAAIRGKKQFHEGEEHYWEIQMSSAVYGTDMMIGIGTSTVDLNKYKSQFCSIIGKGPDSWGISYFGTLHHNGKTKEYTNKFERGAVIGCHLDLWKGTLSFYKNGKALGIAFDGLLGKQLYPIISSTAARTRMKLLCCHTTSFSLQYLCCKEISKSIPCSEKTLSILPVPNGMQRYISWRLEWVFKLNKGSSSCEMGPKRKRIKKKTKILVGGTTDLQNSEEILSM